MPYKDINKKLDQLFDDPLKGTLRKGKETVLSDLRKRLDRIQNRQHNRSIQDSRNINYKTDYQSAYIETLEEIDIFSLSSVGQKIEDADNKFALWENDLSLETRHGDVSLGSIKRLPTSNLVILSGDNRFIDCDFRELLFIDTETTGLSGGTGTLAFLIGFGFFTDTSFKVRQFFLRDYPEESAALNNISDFISRFRYLVTFNGRGFDLPLLQARMVLNRINCNLSSFPHLDLLFPSRSIFKHRLESCRLSSLENNVLHFFREDDIHGDEIPYLYFRYLRSRNPALMDKVFYHNAMDITSLAALTTLVSELISGEDSIFEFGEDVFGVAQLFDRIGRQTEAEKYYLMAMKYILPYNLRVRLLTGLSLLLKRTGRIDEASEIWKGMIDGQQEYDIFPFEELAKYYEHYKKSFKTALEIVQIAISKLENLKYSDNILTRKTDRLILLHRLHRLEKKLGGKTWGY